HQRNRYSPRYSDLRSGTTGRETTGVAQDGALLSQPGHFGIVVERTGGGTGGLRLPRCRGPGGGASTEGARCGLGPFPGGSRTVERRRLLRGGESLHSSIRAADL